jgi:YfiH family protein
MAHPHPVLIVPDWPAPTSVRAGTSTRVGGVSQENYASFNLAGHVGDQAICVAANRDILQQVFALPEQPVWLNQVHGIDVLRRDRNKHVSRSESQTYDACYTADALTVCAVLTADCLPVLFCSQDGQEVAAAHAGWRGLVDGVLEATVNSFSARPADILVWLGPAIGPASFEVGQDVRQRFINRWGSYGVSGVEVCFRQAGHAQWYGDLYALARLQLKQSGVERIYGGGEDTYVDRQNFFSYRRDGDTGRMVSLIWRHV